MGFIEISTIWYNSQSNKYESSGSMIVNIDTVSKITSYSWKDSKDNKHEYREIWFKGETHQDTVKVSINEWDDIKKHFKLIAR